MATVLIVDDDPQLRKSFEKLLSEEGHKVLSACTGEDGFSIVESSPVDLVIMDVRLPGISGLEAYQKIRKIEHRLPVIFMTAFGTTDTAIRATKLGAFDYVLKPFNIPDMLSMIEQALEAGRIMRNPIEIDTIPETGNSEAMIGKSAVMQEIYKLIGRTAPTDTTVLIRGESGTGKELAARALYQYSLRSEKPFVVINCVAIPETLLEAELFGHERGAFTGAVRKRVGKIEQAHDGTVFLDEIGDMPLSIQAKILRLLQEKSIERIGANEPINTDVRIIAATNRNLESLINKGAFREDLYYRLNVVSIEMPPLRDRLDDIPLLSRFFLTKFSREMSFDNPGITDEAITLLSKGSWSGNVRELANTIQKALIFSRGCPIGPDDISTIINDKTPTQDFIAREEIIKEWVRQLLKSKTDTDIFTHLIDRFSSIVIKEVLELTHGNRSQAAQILGLSRPTLQSKIEKYCIKIETSIKNN